MDMGIFAFFILGLVLVSALGPVQCSYSSGQRLRRGPNKHLSGCAMMDMGGPAVVESGAKLLGVGGVPDLLWEVETTKEPMERDRSNA
jgi:hypothetical protein